MQSLTLPLWALVLHGRVAVSIGCMLINLLVAQAQAQVHSDMQILLQPCCTEHASTTPAAASACNLGWSTGLP